MMRFRRSRDRMALVAAAVLIAMAVLTAGCSTTGSHAPSSTTTTTTTTTPMTAPSSSAPMSPTEKSINPTGGNLFTPPVVAPPAQTVPPGQHPGINGVS
jgi:ABC-type Fe3+-hydroxamate transport system substrate-binding protein